MKRDIVAIRDEADLGLLDLRLADVEELVVLLAELQAADQIDWSRAAVDSSYVRARGGGEKTGPSPVDRRKKGSKHHAVVDGGGIPLAATVTR